MARSAQSENRSAIRDGRGTRTGLIFLIEPGVPTDFVSVSPKWLPRFLVKTMHPLPHLRLLWLAISDIDPSISDDRTGIAPANWRTPANVQPPGRKSLQNADLAPDTVAVGPAEL